MKVPNTRLQVRIRTGASGGVDIDVAVPARRKRPRRARTLQILFVAADPHATPRLELDRECAAIQRELSIALDRDQFRFESRWATSIDDLLRHLTHLEPTVLHFSGHGRSGSGLVLQDELGRPQPVSTRALTMMIGAASQNLRLVVLNACYSAAQAAVLCRAADCVIGMDGAIADGAARVFAACLYGAIGSRRSVGNAFELATAALVANELPDAATPRCLTRSGIDPYDIVLAR